MIIEEAYNRLTAFETRMSKSQFCREYLGVNRNYWFISKHQNHDISHRVMLRLYQNLRERAATWGNIAASTDSSNNSYYAEKQRNYSQLADWVLRTAMESAKLKTCITI